MLCSMTLLIAAAQAGPQTWFVNERPVAFQVCMAHACLMHCPVPSNCLAKDYFREPLRGEVGYGGTNPGSGVCEKRGGYIEQARDATGNEMAICHLPDDSLISLDGLWIW